MGVPDPAPDLGRAVRGTSGPENQGLALEPVGVPAPEETSDPAIPEQDPDLAGMALVHVAAESSWCSPSAVAFSGSDFRLPRRSTEEQRPR